MRDVIDERYQEMTEARMELRKHQISENKRQREMEEKGRQIRMAVESPTEVGVGGVGGLGLEDDLLQINRELKMELESFNTSLDKWKSGSCASPGSSHFEFSCADILSGAVADGGKLSW